MDCSWKSSSFRKTHPHKTSRLSQERDTSCCLRKSLPMKPFVAGMHASDFGATSSSSVLAWRPRRNRSSRFGPSRICVTMPTNRSSTLWLSAADNSMYLLRWAVHTSFASATGDDDKLDTVIYKMWVVCCDSLACFFLHREFRAARHINHIRPLFRRVSIKAKLSEISSDTHQLHYTPKHPFYKR